MNLVWSPVCILDTNAGRRRYHVSHTAAVCAQDSCKQAHQGGCAELLGVRPDEGGHKRARSSIGKPCWTSMYKRCEDSALTNKYRRVLEIGPSSRVSLVPRKGFVYCQGRFHD